ncbi:MAG TPA: NAD(P)-dependent oxidoreductase [Polyangiaceae bacterium]|nr:NAD(P)-dependent oxidoreductase [Polyangiaceae bacterium]
MTTKHRTKIAFLGLGAMGARMATRLVSGDIDLQVWSRSGVPKEFTSLASHLVPTPEAAVAGADMAIAMVTDDPASRGIWLDSGALRGMRRGAVAVECSTLTPTWVAELARHARHAGVAFIDAPVVGSRPQAEAGNLIFLAGGDASALDTVRPTLLRMGSAIHHLGASPAGALSKLLANALFTTQVAAVAEIIALARRGRLDLPTLARTLEALPVMSPAAKGAMTGMLAGGFTPMFPISLATKDLGYAVAEGTATRLHMPMTSAARDVFARGLESGLSDENLTAVVKLYAAGHAGLDERKPKI